AAGGYNENPSPIRRAQLVGEASEEHKKYYEGEPIDGQQNSAHHQEPLLGDRPAESFLEEPVFPGKQGRKKRWLAGVKLVGFRIEHFVDSFPAVFSDDAPVAIFVVGGDPGGV